MRAARALQPSAMACADDSRRRSSDCGGGTPATALLALALLARAAAATQPLPLPRSCTVGAYRLDGVSRVAQEAAALGAATGALGVEVPGCPGFWLCEPGYACDGGVRVPCAAGTFAAHYGAAACDACPARAYCAQ